jgi:hypothetical protein
MKRGEREKEEDELIDGREEFVFALLLRRIVGFDG